MGRSRVLTAFTSSEVCLRLHMGKPTPDGTFTFQTSNTCMESRMTRTAIALLCCAWVLGCGGASRDAEGTREILENLSKAGFPASDTRVVDGAVYVGGDAAVSLDASREMLETGNTRQEQYRTNNVVSTQIQIIKIRPSSSTPVKIRQGLVEAIANFNDLSFGINFALEPNPCELDPNCPP
ncbi:hypothetical protein D7V77_41410, partial [Corallococcus sp. CA041A]